VVAAPAALTIARSATLLINVIFPILMSSIPL